ncbi:hypothetical protein HJC23_003319 [Cyclotella cryptica]|uniref:Uncharacterized protein n=1 Tax=Cyclotella cryptica TaxID=29204 RepID=A0ABD3R1M3_9STRA
MIAHVTGRGFAFALSLPSHPPLTTVVSRKSNGRNKEYFFDHHEPSVEKEFPRLANGVHRKDKIFSSVLDHLQSVLRSTFLPTIRGSYDGGQKSQLTLLMESGYLPFILFDNLQDLTTSLRSVLATQRILEGVGVGRSGATALSATLNFLIRDGCGMVASLLFTSLAASSFRRNIKRWKYFADIMVDIGITLEIVAPSLLATQFSGWFLPLLCMGNVCKALCGVAAGATGGALQMFWAIKLTGSEDGISEVSAKNGAQRTVMGGMGLILAGLTASWLDKIDGANSNRGIRKKGLWIGLYCGLTFLHLVCNWRSLKLVTLDWLNGWRLHRVVDDFLASIDEMSNDCGEDISCSNPSEVSTWEPIFFVPELHSKQSHLSRYPIRLGVSFNQFAKLSRAPSSTLKSIMTTKRTSSKDNYILKVGHTNKQLEKNRCILVSFLSECSNKEKAKAYLHACLVGRALVLVSAPNGEQNNKPVVHDEREIIRQAEEIGQREINVLWPIFERSASKAGWKLDKTEFSTYGYEICLE